MNKILFVCTGNICRSPTAEALLRDKINQDNDVEGSDKGGYVVESAGTHGYHIGNPPDERAIRLAAQHGVSMEGMKAQKFVFQDFYEFDYIFAMDEGHLKFMQAMMPNNTQVHEERAGQLMLFSAYNAPESSLKTGGDVPDPYYGSEADFKKAYEIIEEGINSIWSNIKPL